MFFVFEKFWKITSLAKLSDNTGIVFGAEHFIELKNVGYTFEKFEDFNFVGKKIFVDFSFDKFEVNHFDGYLFICIDIWVYLFVSSFL